MLRDGPYMGESDTLMRLSGVYVPASGKLHALLEPPHPVVLPFAPHEASLASLHYRSATCTLPTGARKPQALHIYAVLALFRLLVEFDEAAAVTIDTIVILGWPSCQRGHVAHRLCNRSACVTWCRQALREAAQQVAAGQRQYQSAAEELQRGLGLDTRPLVRIELRGRLGSAACHLAHLELFLLVKGCCIEVQAGRQASRRVRQTC